MTLISRSVQVAALAGAISCVTGLSLDVNDQTSIQTAAKTLVEGLYTYHNADNTEGQFNQPQPYYWWESGAGWTSIVNYQSYTKDTTYQSDLLASVAENLGPNNDFVTTAQSGWEANDDQAYWVFIALDAMEYDYPALPCTASNSSSSNSSSSNSSSPSSCANSWFNIGVSAFEDFVYRWNIDSTTCGGGLKWQYNPQASGYYYKNSVSNGGFFQTAARLARYSGNQTYTDWANKIWDWTSSIGLLDSNYNVYDGTGDNDGANCTGIDHDQWTYTIGSYMHGAAHMYGATGDSTWESRVAGLLSAANTTFFSPTSNATGIMYEQNCETAGTCSPDQTSFKASLTQWMAKTSVLVPGVSDEITTLLKSTAVGAAASCSGLGNNTCGIKWYIDGWDGQVGFGEQLSALEAVQSLLIGSAPTLAKM